MVVESLSTMVVMAGCKGGEGGGADCLFSFSRSETNVSRSGVVYSLRAAGDCLPRLSLPTAHACGATSIHIRHTLVYFGHVDILALVIIDVDNVSARFRSVVYR